MHDPSGIYSPKSGPKPPNPPQENTTSWKNICTELKAKKLSTKPSRKRANKRPQLLASGPDDQCVSGTEAFRPILPFRLVHRCSLYLVFAMFGKTIPAIYRAISARHEWDFGGYPAVSADHRGQLAFGLLPSASASLASLRFVNEPFLRIEFLLAGCEDELLFAFPTLDRLVHKRHLSPPLA
jgi:hypothetical protein